MGITIGQWGWVCPIFNDHLMYCFVNLVSGDTRLQHRVHASARLNSKEGSSSTQCSIHDRKPFLIEIQMRLLSVTSSIADILP